MGRSSDFSLLTKKPLHTWGETLFQLAEREGFEPSVELSPHTHLAGERLQPTRPSLRNPAEAGYY